MVNVGGLQGSRSSYPGLSAGHSTNAVEVARDAQATLVANRSDNGESQSTVSIPGANQPKSHRCERHGEKAVGQTEAMEQRHCAWAKGRLHARSSEANSTSARASSSQRAQRLGPLLGSHRHHAARAGTTQSRY